MKKDIAGRILLIVVPAIMLGVSSCSTSSPTDGSADSLPATEETPVALTNSVMPSAEVTTALLMVEGLPGGVIVDTLTLDAEVLAVDHAARTATLLLPGGEKAPIKVGPEAINFDLVKKGDRVKALVTETLSIYIGDENAPEDDGVGAVAVFAEKGEQPGGAVAEKGRSTAIITAIDLAAHTATLQFKDGTLETVKVRPDVDLSKQKVGTKVVFEVTRIIALSVEKK